MRKHTKPVNILKPKEIADYTPTVPRSFPQAPRRNTCPPIAFEQVAYWLSPEFSDDYGVFSETINLVKKTASSKFLVLMVLCNNGPWTARSLSEYFLVMFGITIKPNQITKAFTSLTAEGLLRKCPSGYENYWLHDPRNVRSEETGEYPKPMMWRKG